MKDNPASVFVNMTLKVPRGLVKLLDMIKSMTGEAPKEYLESVLTKELNCILSDLPGNIFNLKLIETTYGEGSEV
jgi:hypothetical protein